MPDAKRIRLVIKPRSARIPFYYGDSARFTSTDKLYVDFDHMFRTVVLPHNLASSAYTHWMRNGASKHMCLDFSLPPTEHTSLTPFNVCNDHENCRLKMQRKLLCPNCNSDLVCTSSAACSRTIEQRKEAFARALAFYNKEERISSCTEFWDYIFAGEEKLAVEERSKTQHEMLQRVWAKRPKGVFFLRCIYNPTACAEGVINLALSVKEK